MLLLVVVVPLQDDTCQVQKRQLRQSADSVQVDMAGGQ
jgi:hypothetical protein